MRGTARCAFATHGVMATRNSGSTHLRFTGASRSASMKPPHMKTFLVLACLACIPATAAGQGAIAGAVTDPFGAAMPGVAVEIGSPVLIEKTRSATTDGAGRYRIEALRPGVYSILFTQADWSPLQQEGIVVNAATTTRVDGRLMPAGVVESVTVTALPSPTDRRISGHALTLNQDELSSLPTVRSYNALLGFVPGVVTSTNDVVNGTAATAFPIHGGRANEGRLLGGGRGGLGPADGELAASHSGRN